MTASTELITSQHVDKPKYTSMVDMTCQPFDETTGLYSVMNQLYDLDSAVGIRLDVIGQWVGVSRYLTTPIAGVFFSFDITNLGFDQAVWLGPYDVSTGLTTLPDDYYRLIIKTKILNNHWDGSIAQAYEIANTIFNPFGYNIIIQDNNDLTFDFGVVSTGQPTALVTGLLLSGKFDIKPAGIKIKRYIAQTTAAPIFAFDINNATLSGFDLGGWATISEP